MSTFQLPGLATGIDTAKLVQQLMIIESRRLARYQVARKDYDVVTRAFDLLRKKIGSLKTAAGKISDSDKLNYFNTSSSDTSVLTASASAQAKEGSHSVIVSQLATGETWIQDTSTFDFKTSYVGKGTFIYSYNYKETGVPTTGETTLEDLVGLINNDQNNPGVTASLLYHGGKYHLMLTGRQTGTDYHISINSSTTEVLESTTAGGAFTLESTGEHATLTTKITELGEFDDPEGGLTGLQGDEFIRISGKNHFDTDLTDLDMDVTEETTVGDLILKINEHFDGVATAIFINGQIRLTDHMSGDSDLAITLTYDKGATGDTDLTLPTLAVKTAGGTAGGLALLSPGSFIETQNAQDSKLKLDGYPSGTAQEIQTLSCIGGVATGGTFTLTYKGETTDPIDFEATIGEIQAALVALSTVEDGDITVEDFSLDEAGDTTFKFKAELGDVSMITIDTTLLQGPTGVSIVESTKGSDGWLHGNGNTVSNILTGVTLRLVDVCEYDDVAEEYEAVKVTISRNTSTVKSQVEGVVSAYNDLVDFLAEYTEYDAEKKKMGILSNNLAVRLIKSQMNLPFIGIVQGFAAPDKFLEARDIGLTVTGEGKLELDADTFEDAINQEKGFESVIDLLGAAAKGGSDSTIIQFYSASDKYTTAGTYDVKVTVTDNVITSAQIKLTTESEYRDTDIKKTNLFMGDSEFDEYGEPLHPENGLQITVELGTDGDFTAKVRVKQGCVGALEDLLVETVETGGRLTIAEDVIGDQIEAMEKRIANEQARLDDAQQRLVEKFARLERTLASLQEQLSAVGILYSMIFGG